MMKRLISRVFSGTTDRSSEIFIDDEKKEFCIQYFDELGNFVRMDYFPGKTEDQVRFAAEDWILTESDDWHKDMFHSEMSDLMISMRSAISSMSQRNVRISTQLITD